jgi:hypothetical protein
MEILAISVALELSGVTLIVIHQIAALTFRTPTWMLAGLVAATLPLTLALNLRVVEIV